MGTNFFKRLLACFLTTSALSFGCNSACVGAPTPPQLVAPKPFQPLTLPATLPGEWRPVGRVKIGTTANSVIVENGFVMSPVNVANGDYQMSFRARAMNSPEGV